MAENERTCPSCGAAIGERPGGRAGGCGCGWALHQPHGHDAAGQQWKLNPWGLVVLVVGILAILLISVLLVSLLSPPGPSEAGGAAEDQTGGLAGRELGLPRGTLVRGLTDSTWRGKRLGNALDEIGEACRQRGLKATWGRYEITQESVYGVRISRPLRIGDGTSVRLRPAWAGDIRHHQWAPANVAAKAVHSGSLAQGIATDGLAGIKDRR